MKTLALLLALLSVPAWAVYQCGDTVDSCQCGGNNPYPCCDNGGNCTWYAWEAACCHWAVALPSWGNANQWAGNAQANASFSALSYPVTDAVSCRTLGTYGHVAYVTALSGGNVTVNEQNCFGNYGEDTGHYTSSFFQFYITRAGQTQCSPGDSQTQACGNCGTQSRGCNVGGTWDGWGACGSEGECAPGDSQSESCGACGTHARSCSSSCSWNAYDAQCSAGADPDAGTLACDTGLAGACADGRLRCGANGEVGCVALLEPAAESCDGVDNDCNDSIDDGLSCGGNSGELQPQGDEPPGVHVPSTRPGPVRGGCESAGGFSALALLVTMGTHRRRRR